MMHIDVLYTVLWAVLIPRSSTSAWPRLSSLLHKRQTSLLCSQLSRCCSCAPQALCRGEVASRPCPQLVLACCTALVSGGGITTECIFKHNPPQELVDRLAATAAGVRVTGLCNWAVRRYATMCCASLVYVIRLCGWDAANPCLAVACSLACILA